MYLSMIILCFILSNGVVASFNDIEKLNNGDEGTYCDGTGWTLYRDEKCIKLIEKFAKQVEAREMCADELLKLDSSEPQLVTIKSIEEQEYLTEFIFVKSEVVVNVWIGATRSSDNNDKFVWNDGSEVGDFTNWAQECPSSDTRKGCVVMQSELSRKYSNISMKSSISNGQWRDVPCAQANYVICEKLPRWSFTKLQQTLLDTRKELKDTNLQVSQEFAETKRQLVNTRTELSQTRTDLENTKTELSQTKSQLATVQSNPVPIGFIYVQLSSQLEPKTLWPAVQWKDVTSEYAGLFFRAEGGGSAQFGAVQTENAPRVTQVRYQHYEGGQGDLWTQTNLTVGGWGTGIGVFSGSWNGRDAMSHHFFQSGGEVRPRNIATRLWKRIL